MEVMHGAPLVPSSTVIFLQSTTKKGPQHSEPLVSDSRVGSYLLYRVEESGSTVINHVLQGGLVQGGIVTAPKP